MGSKTLHGDGRYASEPASLLYRLTRSKVSQPCFVMCEISLYSRCAWTVTLSRRSLWRWCLTCWLVSVAPGSSEVRSRRRGRASIRRVGAVAAGVAGLEADWLLVGGCVVAFPPASFGVTDPLAVGSQGSREHGPFPRS